jgi:hypothetical protein
MPACLLRRCCHQRLALGFVHFHSGGNASQQLPAQGAITTIALQCREDEYDVGYVYAGEANNKDITARSITPLLRKFVEGYNVTAVVFGATGERRPCEALGDMYSGWVLTPDSCRALGQDAIMQQTGA